MASTFKPAGPATKKKAEAAYVEKFIEVTDEEAHDISRKISKTLEANSDMMALLQGIETTMDTFLGEDDSSVSSNGDAEHAKWRLEALLTAALRCGDNRVQYSQEIEDMVDDKLSTLDDFFKETEEGEKEKSGPSSTGKVKLSMMRKFQSQSPDMARAPLSSSEISLSTGSSPVSKGFETGASSSPVPGPSTSKKSCNMSKLLAQKMKSVTPIRNSPRKANATSSSAANVRKIKPLPVSQLAKSPAPMVRRSPALRVRGKVVNYYSPIQKKQNPRANVASKEKDREPERKTAESKSSNTSESSSDEEEDDDDDSTDSNEPTYCICEKVSSGKMIQCDNAMCPLEWFHFKCVGLKRTPKEWFCPRCRGETYKVMKPRALLVSELKESNQKMAKEMGGGN